MTMKPLQKLHTRLPFGEFSKNRAIHFPLISGFISSISQVVLLRELMIEVNGNEIIFSFFLSIWLFLVALGTYLNQIIKFKKNNRKTNYLIILILIVITPLQFLFIHFLTAKIILISGMIINIPTVILIAFLTLFPGCLLIGFLFPLNCSLFSNLRNPVHKVYILECFGMILGGIYFFLFIIFFRNFSLMVLMNFISVFYLWIYEREIKLLIIAIFILILLLFSNSIFLKNYASRFIPQKLISSQDSPSGRFDVTALEQQQNYFWDGTLIGNSENQNYAEEMVNFALLQHPEPKNILLIGGLLNGFPEEFNKENSLEQIDYLEMEKNIIDYYQENYQQENRKLKANFIKQDPIKYLRKNPEKYDLIYVSFPDPSSIFLNRFYTSEFLNLLKNHLVNEKSVTLITVSNSANFLLPELAELNSILNKTFTEVFEKTVIIPAKKCIYAGSSGNYISNDPDTLKQRMFRRNKVGNWFNSALINDVCNNFRINDLQRRISQYDSEINSNLNPRAYLLSILFWAKHLNISLSKGVNFLKNNKIILLFGILIFLFIIPYFSKKISGNTVNFKQNFNIFSISFIAIISELILIYLIQINFGFVYYVISILTMTFMLGLSLGFIISDKIEIQISRLFLIFLFLLFILFLILNAAIPLLIIFIFNTFIAVLEGLILSKNLSEINNIETAKKGTFFYFLDTLGATCGGFILGIFLLPFFSIREIIGFLMMILIMNFIISFKFWNFSVD